ncbi:MAG: N-acetyltransferase [Gemmatimonadota bacterium]
MIRIEEVNGRRGTAAFVDAWWQIRAASGAGPANGSRDAAVAPLRMVVKDALDTRGNPFYQDADRALFLAYDEGRVVGRIAAIENRWHNRHHEDRVGFFGFFESIDDVAVAGALLSRAEEWLAHRGLTSSRGPISPSMNHESGLLVEGFEHPPVLMTPWNPAYYVPLLEAAAYGKVQDLLGYDIPADRGLAIPERIGRLAERTKKRTGIRFRSLDVSILEREAGKVRDLYCDAWSGNWGFVPPSWEEFWHTAKDLKSVLVPEFSYVAEVGDEIVGFMLLARDVNEVLRDVPSGRLTPITVFKLLTRLPRVRRGRIVLLGLRAEYRNRGLFPLFSYESARLAQETGFLGAEASWILDDNDALIAPMEAMGLRAYKRWRIYERTL